MTYTVVRIPGADETGRYVAYVPTLPGCVTFGDSIDDALAMAMDAAHSVIAGMHEDGDPIPHEPTGAVVTSITVETMLPAGVT